MKANELRIGNWYEEDGRPFRATWMTIRDVFKDKARAAWCKPLPLTEEWLVKFGFVLKVTGDDVYEQEWHIDGQMLIWGPTSDNGYCHDFHTGGHIQSVHQLQNLYFALTGEELTIKDTIE